jgi:hypothetical protein
MSALAPKADMNPRNLHVRFVPKADIVLTGFASFNAIGWTEFAGSVQPCAIL